MEISKNVSSYKVIYLAQGQIFDSCVRMHSFVWASDVSGIFRDHSRYIDYVSLPRHSYLIKKASASQ